MKAIKEKLIKDREDEKRNYVLPGIKIEEGDRNKYDAQMLVPFAPGQAVKVERRSGEIENDWAYMGLDMDNPGKLLVVKNITEAGGLKRELRKSIKLSHLIELNK